MKEKRIEEIIKYLSEHKIATTKDLAEAFHVTQNTIRWDLKQLEDQNLVTKFHGGVKFNDNGTPLNIRNITAIQEKNKIAKKAAEFIKNGDSIFIDAGTTTKNILKYVPNDRNITVITNNIDIIIDAVDKENINLIIVGEHYNRRLRSIIRDDSDYRWISSYNIQSAFMGVTGLSLGAGLTNFEVDEIPLKSQVVSQASHIFLLADSTKFNKPSLKTYLPLENIDVLITNGDPDPAYLEFCQKNNIAIEIVD